MSNMNLLGEHILGIANQKKGRISNLQLQKVLYFIIGDYIAVHGIDDFIEDTYDERMEAWKYGPVLKSEYDKNRIYGSMKIRKPGEIQEELNTFNIFINQRIMQNIGDLIDESHEHDKWKNNKEDILKKEKKIYYDLEDFENEFSA